MQSIERKKTKTDKQLAHQAIPCFTPKKIYALEKNWFVQNDSFGLMQQAAWQMAHWLKHHFPTASQSVLVVVGSGNNGGDGWALASFLQNLCPNWQINVLEISKPTTDNAKQAKKLFNGNILNLKSFLQNQQNGLNYHFDLIIDGLFGIGLDRQPTSDYGKAIRWINDYRQRFQACQVVSIDVPSGLNAATGKVYEKIAIKADVTLCLIARKIGLHLLDSKDCVGKIIELPLIPVIESPSAYYHHQVPTLPKRPNNTHKGDYGHVLIIGGNQLENGVNDGQGMAGASLLAAECAFAVGAGKVTVACHREFHSAIITALPNAMTADLHNVESVGELIKNVDVVAIGMGLGRDKIRFELFKTYLQAVIDNQKACVIDADGLYHLADVPKTIINQLKKSQVKIYCTPHSGEAGRLLNIEYKDVDKDKLTALSRLKTKFGGDWLIKGAETLVLENSQTYICGLGNSGMATAGMGDCLSGLAAGLFAQQKILQLDYPLITATLIHAKAGDLLARQVGEYALSAKDMPQAIEKIIESID